MPPAQKNGFGLIETIIGASLVTIIIVGIGSVSRSALNLSKHNLEETKAQFLLVEAAEALRAQRDNGWNYISSLSTSTAYYILFSTSTTQWISTTTKIVIDGTYTRTVNLSDVFRNGTDDIVPSGTYDNGSKKGRISVSWNTTGATTTKTLDLYLTNL